MRLILALAIAPLAAAAALAQEPVPLTARLCSTAVEVECLCAVPLTTPGTASVAKISKMEGAVIVSRAAGTSYAAQGADLVPGDRVITGVNSRAELVVAGSCELPVSAQSMVTLSEVEGCACAKLTGIDGEAGAAAHNGNGGGDGVLFWTAMSLIPPLVGVVDTLTNDSDDDLSEEPTN